MIDRIDALKGSGLSTTEFEIEINDAMRLSNALHARIKTAIRLAAGERRCHRGQMGVAIVDDQSIHEINQRHLGHDYPTDVISFGYTLQPPLVEGEMVVSLETARKQADQLGWSVESELLLYIVHGALHICGMDDLQQEQRLAMRHTELRVMSQLGINEFVRYHPDYQATTLDEEDRH